MESTKESSLIQRIEALEDKLGIKLSGINVDISEDDESSYTITVMGEILAKSGGSLESSLSIKVSVLDKFGKVIGTGDQWVNNDRFYAIDTLNIMIDTKNKNIETIKIFPVKE